MLVARRTVQNEEDETEARLHPGYTESCAAEPLSSQAQLRLLCHVPLGLRISVGRAELRLRRNQILAG